MKCPKEFKIQDLAFLPASVTHLSVEACRTSVLKQHQVVTVHFPSSLRVLRLIGLLGPVPCLPESLDELVINFGSTPSLSSDHPIRHTTLRKLELSGRFNAPILAQIGPACKFYRSDSCSISLLTTSLVRCVI